MKTSHLILPLLFLIYACTPSNEPTNLNASQQVIDTMPLSKVEQLHELPPQRNWQKTFLLTHNPNRDSLWGKPFSYYIEQPNCSELAIDFYYGRFRPTDNLTTKQLLDLAVTKDEALRPFYLWCLHQTILIADGALCAYIGKPARNFIQHYPEEFFALVAVESSSNTYNRWVGGIIYSGFYGEHSRFQKLPNKAAIQQHIEKEFSSNCTPCSPMTRKNIQALSFALADGLGIF